jgi:hypothetical protein
MFCARLSLVFQKKGRLSKEALSKSYLNFSTLLFSGEILFVFAKSFSPFLLF